MVSIIILTYNSEKHIQPLVESIYSLNSGQDFEIIVVDNASPDKTVDRIKKLGKKVKFVDNKKNAGFAAGINVGAKQAQGKYLLFVNPDCEWRSGTIADMVKVFDRNEKIGIVGGRMVNRAGVVEKSAGKFIGLIEGSITAFGLDNVFGIRYAPKKIERVDFLSGGFMMVKKNVFDELSGFDENLFMYVEDMDLCFRAKKRDILTYFTPDVEVMHESHGSSNRGFAIKNIYKGFFYFQKQHKGPISYFVVKSLFVTKARTLVLLGKIMNNKYLIETYQEALKA